MSYCLIGEKLAHSYSSEIHEFMELKYSLKEIKKSELAKFTQNLKSMGIAGFNVTIPYKEDIIPLLDYIDDTAKNIGSVNTVKVKNNMLFGFNTDIFGLDYILKRKNIDICNKNVTILGSGGTSKTAFYLAKEKGAKSINIISRNGEINYENCYDKLKDTEILINTTPVGMYPNVDECLIDIKRFSNIKFICDCVYNPLKTKLLLCAEKLNIPYSNGLPMLVAQALKSESIWQDKELNYSDIERTINYILYKKSNLVLYGMPSCGKSHLGRFVAKQMGRKFFDSDVEFSFKFSLTPQKAIEKYGEDYFRERESQVVLSLAKESGQVIALGGGSVLRSENVEALKQNSILIYINRPLELLSTKNRPLSIEKGIETIFNERKEIYNSIKDLEILNNSEINEIVKKVIKEYENTCSKWC